MFKLLLEVIVSLNLSHFDCNRRGVIKFFSLLFSNYFFLKLINFYTIWKWIWKYKRNSKSHLQRCLFSDFFTVQPKTTSLSSIVHMLDELSTIAKKWSNKLKYWFRTRTKSMESHFNVNDSNWMQWESSYPFFLRAEALRQLNVSKFFSILLTLN
jgi:hypothetical protein